MSRDGETATPRVRPGSFIQLGVDWRLVPTHGHGLRGPVLRGSILWPAKPLWDRSALQHFLRERGGLAAADVGRSLGGGWDIDAFLQLVFALEKLVPTPVAQVGVTVGGPSDDGQHLRHEVALPCRNATFTRAAIHWLAYGAGLVHAEVTPQRRAALADVSDAQLKSARNAAREQLRWGGVNTTRIAQACAELDLPLRLLPRGLLQVGAGRSARLFHSTLTEATPAMAMTLTQSKSLTASLLALQGLPVPRHVHVASEDAAAAAARELGYPVVVKPDDRDGGVGVHAGLQDEDQVRRSYRLAAAESQRVLVEKHVEGRDYRITVDNGRVVKAIGRRPGGVTGDGKRTVTALLEADAIAGRDRIPRRKPVPLDDEALGMLAERGMDAGSVPRDGEFIALRRRANMSTGGTSEDALALLHPDNARLAVRAAELLRLDLAGVDLLIPDIAVSWLEGGAAICEVNAMPQISTEFAPEVYRDLLRRMVPSPGRLRAVLLLDAGAADIDQRVADAAAALMAQGEHVVSVRTDGTWLDAERVAPAPADRSAAAAAAELDRQATAAVVALTPEELLDKGLPWFHLDQCCLVGGSPASGADPQRVRAALAMLAPHLVGELVIAEELAASLGPIAPGALAPRSRMHRGGA